MLRAIRDAVSVADSMSMSAEATIRIKEVRRTPSSRREVLWPNRKASFDIVSARAMSCAVSPSFSSS